MLRICQENDCRDIWKINKEELGYSIPFEVAKKQLGKTLRDMSQRCYVYECDGEVVGYVHAYTYNLLYAEPMINVVGLAVRKSFQHNGIGGLLLLMVEDWATDIGASSVRMSMSKTRTEAHGFYESWGYEITKEQLNFVKKLD